MTFRATVLASAFLSLLGAVGLAAVTAWLNRFVSYRDVFVLWLYLQAPLLIAALVGGSLCGGFLWWRRKRRPQMRPGTGVAATLAAGVSAVVVLLLLAAVRSEWWYFDTYPWVDSWAEMLWIVAGSLVVVGAAGVLVFALLFRLLRPGVERLHLDRPVIWVGVVLAAQVMFVAITWLSRDGRSGAAPPEHLPPRASAVGRVALIGFDGLVPRILDDLLARGELPNFARLIGEGQRFRLATLKPTNSPILWTSMATGVDRSRHGVRNFLVQHPRGLSEPIGTFPSHLGLNTTFLLRRFYGSDLVPTYPVSGAQRRAATIWEVASAYGLTVGVVNWWPSWPAQEVNGFLLSDQVDEYFRLKLRDGGGGEGPAVAHLTHPPELIDEIEAKAAANGWRRIGDDHLVELATELYERHRPDLFAVYLQGTDSAQHRYWDAFEPRFFRAVDPDRIAEHAHEIPDAYRRADRNLGRLLDVLEEDTTVIVVSDHGAGPVFGLLSYHGYVGGHEHAPPGVLIAAGAGVRYGSERLPASLLDVAPTALAVLGLPDAEDMDGRVLEEMFAEPLVAADGSGRARVETWSFLARSGQATPDAAISRAEEEALRALGYL